MANETTTAPSSGKTLTNVLPKIPEELLNFVTCVDQHFNLRGTLLTREEAFKEWGYTGAEYDDFIGNPLVVAALKERDIEVAREQERLEQLAAPPESREAKLAKRLTPLQLVAANKLLNLTDQRSDAKKLQDIGVKPATYQSWLRNEAFSNYLVEMSESLLTNSQHEASLALLDKVKAGDLAAIKFHMEYTGRIARENDSSNSSVRDIQGLLVKILEIVVEECDGPTAIVIADRMKEATAIHSLAVDLSSTIVKPPTAKMREMTPEMQALAELTEGGDV